MSAQDRPAGRTPVRRQLGELGAVVRGVAPQRVLDRVAPRVRVSPAGTDLLGALRGPVMFAANHHSNLDAQFVADAAPAQLAVSTLPVAAALRLHRSVLVFPEHGISPDGTLGRFHDDELVVARRLDIAVVPTAIRGSLGLDTEPSRWRTDGIPRVLVRFGSPMWQPDADAVRAAVAALLVEDAGTWWETVGARSDATGQPDGQGGASGWLSTWQELGAPRRPGAAGRPRIWR